MVGFPKSGHIYKCLHNYRSIANYISARNVLLIILDNQLIIAPPVCFWLYVHAESVAIMRQTQICNACHRRVMYSSSN